MPNITPESKINTDDVMLMIPPSLSRSVSFISHPMNTLVNNLMDDKPRITPRNTPRNTPINKKRKITKPVGIPKKQRFKYVK